MFVSHRPITLLQFGLFASVISLSIQTPVPPLSSQIFPPSPFPSSVPSSPSSLSVPPSIPPIFTSSTEEPTIRARCPLMTSPSSVVVRFEDPVTVNCSVPKMGFSLLGWEVSVAPPEPTMDRFLVWSVNSLTNWSIKPMCYALSEHGQCSIGVPVIVYKPPDNVSISFDNHCGPMLDGHLYTLQCEVQHVAPVGRLTVTFYKGQTALRQLHSKNTEKEPVTEVFTMDIVPRKEDDGAQYWCEAKLELGAEGPQLPPVVMSHQLNTTVHFGPQLICPAKLQVREGESLLCDVTGNPRPLVIWYRDGQVVALPTRSSRKHAGKYIVWTKGHLGQKNFTVEVEVLGGCGTASSCNRYFLSLALFIQMIIWL